SAYVARVWVAPVDRAAVVASWVCALASAERTLSGGRRRSKSGYAAILASTALRNAGSARRPPRRRAKARRYGPVSHGSASASVISRSTASGVRLPLNLAARFASRSIKWRGIAATNFAGARFSVTKGLSASRDQYSPDLAS